MISSFFMVANLGCVLGFLDAPAPETPKKIQQLIEKRRGWLAGSLAYERETIVAQFREQMKDEDLIKAKYRLAEIDSEMVRANGAGKRKLANEVKRIKNGLTKTKKNREKRKKEIEDALAVALKSADAKFREMESDPSALPPFDMEAAKVGVIGQLRRYRPETIEVVQVVDDDNAIVRHFAPGFYGATSQAENLFWLSGVSTKEWTDGAKINYSEPLEVVGTKRYETVAGSTKTILLLKPFDPEELRPYLPKAPDEANE